MDNTILKIEFEENLCNNSIKMIKDILEGSLGFKTQIEEVDKSLLEKLERYKEGFSILMEYFESIPQEEQTKIDKRLRRIRL